MPLYKGRVEFDVVVYADTPEEAEPLVEENAREELTHLFDFHEMCPWGIEEVRELKNEDEPPGLKHDQWRVGYAFGAFDNLQKRIQFLEAKPKCAVSLLQDQYLKDTPK
jgi:hypothetical protein